MPGRGDSGGSAGNSAAKLDFLDLPTKDLDRTITPRHGTAVRLTVEYSRS